jgi:cell division protein FtsB
VDAFEFLKKNAPHLLRLRKQKAMRTLEKENADLKKTIKKLKEDLYNAKMELELEHTSIVHNLRKGSQ